MVEQHISICRDNLSKNGVNFHFIDFPFYRECLANSTISADQENAAIARVGDEISHVLLAVHSEFYLDANRGWIFFFKFRIFIFGGGTFGKLYFSLQTLTISIFLFLLPKLKFARGGAQISILRANPDI